MHASFRVGETTVLASDGRCGGHPTFQGFALSLTVANEIRGRPAASAPWSTAGR